MLVQGQQPFYHFLGICDERPVRIDVVRPQFSVILCGNTKLFFKADCRNGLKKSNVAEFWKDPMNTLIMSQKHWSKGNVNNPMYLKLIITGINKTTEFSRNNIITSNTVHAIPEPKV